MLVLDFDPERADHFPEHGHLVDRWTGNETNPYAYLLFFNISTGNIEFQARDGSKTDNFVVLNRIKTEYSVKRYPFHQIGEPQ